MFLPCLYHVLNHFKIVDCFISVISKVLRNAVKQFNLSLLNSIQEFWNKGSEANVIEVEGKRFVKYISQENIFQM